MKITKIEATPVTLRVSLPGLLHGPGAAAEQETAEHVILQVYTDEGLVGLGESSPNGGGAELERSAQRIIKVIEQVTPVLVGADPFQIGPLFQKMNKVVPGCLWAKAGIDIALHDLMGKAADEPVSALLGGSFRDKLPIEFPLTERRNSPEEAGEAAGKAAKAGYVFIELKGGTDSDLDAERVRAVREAIGDKPRLKVDINSGYRSADAAIKSIKKMERYGVDFVEDPLPESDVAGMAKVAAAVDVKIVGDEVAETLPMLVENVVRKKAADAVHLKICKGGISDTVKMIEVAEAAGIVPIVGASYSFGVGIAAVHQVAASMAELHRPDHYGQPFFVKDVLTAPLGESKGYVTVSKKPGLGVELDEKKLKALRTMK